MKKLLIAASSKEDVPETGLDIYSTDQIAQILIALKHNSSEFFKLAKSAGSKPVSPKHDPARTTTMVEYNVKVPDPMGVLIEDVVMTVSIFPTQEKGGRVYSRIMLQVKWGVVSHDDTYQKDVTSSLGGYTYVWGENILVKTS